MTKGIAQIETAQFAELAAMVIRSLPRDIDPNVAQGWIENPASLTQTLRETLMPPEQAVQQLVPPPGGRIHILTVPVILDRPWQEAVRAAGPNTPDSYDIWRMAELYPSTGIGTVQTEIILVNFGPQGGSLEKALAWAEQYGLKQTNPRQVFAIGEQKLYLHKELKMDSMFVVATQECSFGGSRHVCNVWWSGAMRKADLYWADGMGSPKDWFAFARE